MYPVNYLVYGTIFSFILYERYNRLSNKQLNENAIFRFIYAATKRKTHLSTFQGLQQLTSELWRSLPSAYTQLPRRFPRRRNRGVVSSSNKSKADAKERSKTRRKVSYLPSSEDEEANDVANRFRSTSRLNQKEVQKRSQEEGRPPERGGFLRMFFGNRENDSDSNDEEEEAPPQRIGGWRMLRAATTDTVVETRRSGRGATTLTNGSHGTREGREAAAARPSIWKWPSGSGKTPIEDEAVGRRHAARRGRS
ncbi:unnamed protein product [Chondrus crispus]|uniref:Uncharacterized protein n=1 Tax=Chondrus crispus TaxID=2769 RepID=R7QTL5_CHOCR|nr:unnamed protein product [Chondrus crispus]CDF41028.1 unnamed protein product [Chondrus crispus]|eukprot:XP_005711322.1 unnamed protein product [Chondrus crispus]